MLYRVRDLVYISSIYVYYELKINGMSVEWVVEEKKAKYSIIIHR